MLTDYTEGQELKVLRKAREGGANVAARTGDDGDVGGGVASAFVTNGA